MNIKSAWVLLISMGVLLVCVVLVNPFLTNIRVIDMTRAIQEPAARLAHSTLTEAEQGRLIARFTKILPEVIEAYAKSHSCTIVSAHVLARHNDIDITALMIEQTIQRLKHER